MWKRIFELDGTLEDVNEINQAIADLTGDTEEFFDTDDNEWKAWIEWGNGKTYVLADEA
jgi:hypothetical protein